MSRSEGAVDAMTRRREEKLRFRFAAAANSRAVDTLFRVPNEEGSYHRACCIFDRLVAGVISLTENRRIAVVGFAFI